MKKTIKVNIGDTVLLKGERGNAWNQDGHMDHYIGTRVVIETLTGDVFTVVGSWWSFELDDINDRPKTKLYLND